MYPIHGAPPKKYVLHDLSYKDLEMLTDGLCWLIGEIGTALNDCPKSVFDDLKRSREQCMDLRDRICELKEGK